VNDVYHAKATADTELSIIGRAIIMADHSDNAVVLDLHIYHTVYGTVRTDARDYVCWYAFPFAAFVGERSCWTDIHACSTELAICFQVRPAECSADNRLTATIRECKNSSVAYILADTHTASAEDAEVIVAVEEWVVILYR
jgi:hypothetical protein